MTVYLHIVPKRGVTTAARRALHWLTRIWRPTPASESSTLEALALLQLCRLIDLDTHDDAVARLEAEIARCSPDPVWSGADLSTSLVAAAAALRIGGEIAISANAYLEAFDEFDREGLLEGAGGALVRLALRGSEPGPPTAWCPIDLSPHDLASLRATLDTIETISGFGTRRIESDPCAAMLLEGAAMAALRAYDLPLGMRALRARRHLAPGSSLGLSTGLDFIRLLQGDDGSFGDLDAVLARLAASGEVDGDLRLKLPITLQALWTMAELDDDEFRLARDAFPLPRPGLAKRN